MKRSHEELRKLGKAALEDKESYWEDVAGKMVWDKKWTKVFDDSQNPHVKWFVGGELNMCYNCVDRHVKEGNGERIAFIHDSPVTQTHREYTYSQVLDEVSRLAGVLRDAGVEKGDVVMIYMPPIPQGAFSMLACARIGAFHANVTSGLPAKDIVLRIDSCQPKVIVLASHGYQSDGWMNYKEEMDTACGMAQSKPQKIISFQREGQEVMSLVPGRDLDWKTEVGKSSAVECVPVEVNQPAFLIYTSGSTGQPKAVVHSLIFGVRFFHDAPIHLGTPGDVILSTINYGWIAGCMLVAYGPLLSGMTTVIFEGDSLLAENEGLVYDVLTRYQVTICFIRPGVWKALKGKDPDGQAASKYTFDSLKHIGLGGERTDMGTMEWISRTMKAHVWNAYGQTEFASLACGLPDLTLGKDTATVHDLGFPAIGFQIVVLNDEDQEAKPFEIGRLFIKHGVYPNSFLTVFKRPEVYLKYFSHFPGHLYSNDEGFKTDQGYVKVEGRSDDLLKVGLLYVTGQVVEEVVMGHVGVRECIVVSATDFVWIEIPVVMYVKKEGCPLSDDEIEIQVHKMLMETYGTSMKVGHLVRVQEMPVTRTGKVHKPSCRALVRGQEIQDTSIVENPGVFEDIAAAARKAGYGKNEMVSHVYQ